jgi:CBS domain-containing protein
MWGSWILSYVLQQANESIGKIMKTRVIRAPPDDTLRHAAELMIQLRIGSIVVVEKDRPIGIVTERDCVRLMAEGRPADARIGDVMTRPVITCEVGKKVAEAFAMMSEKRINHLPITENGKLVGIVASRDLITASLA